MIELLLPYGFDTLEYSGVKDTIDICILVDCSVAKKCQQACNCICGHRCRAIVFEDRFRAILYLRITIIRFCI
jgi:hypothetical protein